MLSLNKLEKVIELEEQLRAEYQGQLDKMTAQIESHARQCSELQATVDSQQEEISDLKKRVKALQKDLAEERANHKALQQFDPNRMKKNLDANKKKQAEKTRTNDVLQKSLKKSRAEKAELQRQVKELEGKLDELVPEQGGEEEAA